MKIKISKFTQYVYQLTPDNIIILLLSGFCFFIYSIISFIIYNNPSVATDGMDFNMGIFYEIINNYAHFKAPYSSLKYYNPEFNFASNTTIFADHFSPIYILVVPFLWIYNNFLSLLMANVCLITLSVPFIYKMSRIYLSIKLSTILTLVYILNWIIQYQASTGLSESTFYLPITAISLYYYFKKHYIHSAIWMSLLIFVKEDAGLYIALFGLVLFIQHRKKLLSSILILTGILSTYISIFIIIPNASHNQFSKFYTKFYEWMGSTISEKIIFIVTHPLNILHHLYYPPTKTFTYILIGLPFLTLCYFSPFILFPLINFTERFLSTNWDLFNFLERHYNTAYLVFIFAAIIDILNKIKYSNIIHNYCKQYKLKFNYNKICKTYCGLSLVITLVILQYFPIGKIVMNFSSYNPATYIRSTCNQINKNSSPNTTIILYNVGTICAPYLLQQHKIIDVFPPISPKMGPLNVNHNIFSLLFYHDLYETMQYLKNKNITNYYLVTTAVTKNKYNDTINNDDNNETINNDDNEISISDKTYNLLFNNPNNNLDYKMIYINKARNMQLVSINIKTSQIQCNEECQNIKSNKLIYAPFKKKY